MRRVKYLFFVAVFSFVFGYHPSAGPKLREERTVRMKEKIKIQAGLGRVRAVYICSRVSEGIPGLGLCAVLLGHARGPCSGFQNRARVSRWMCVTRL